MKIIESTTTEIRRENYTLAKGKNECNECPFQHFLNCYKLFQRLFGVFCGNNKAIAKQSAYGRKTTKQTLIED